MNRCAMLVIILAAALPAAVLAQTDPPEGTSVLMTASCSGGDVVLSIDFRVNWAPPELFVGWVVERALLGQCAGGLWVTPVMPWPDLGDTHLDLVITPDDAFFDPVYRIWAVDAAGNETFIYWRQRHNFAHADCMPGPTTIGHFVEYLPGEYVFDSCDNSCWPTLSVYDNTYPSGVETYMASGELVALYGTLYSGMEGVYVHATAVQPTTLPCEGIVPGAPTSWGALKADYR